MKELDNELIVNSVTLHRLTQSGCSFIQQLIKLLPSQTNMFWFDDKKIISNVYLYIPHGRKVGVVTILTCTNIFQWVI